MTSNRELFALGAFFVAAAAVIHVVNALFPDQSPPSARAVSPLTEYMAQDSKTPLLIHDRARKVVVVTPAGREYGIRCEEGP